MTFLLASTRMERINNSVVAVLEATIILCVLQLFTLSAGREILTILYIVLNVGMDQYLHELN